MKYVKTEAGQRVMKDRSVPLTPKQRSAFILFDGKRTLEEVLVATAPMGVTREDIEAMVQLDLLAAVEGAGDATKNSVVAVPVVSNSAPPAPAGGAASSGRTSQQRYQDAYPVATRLTASLGLRGFRLNLAVEAATSYEQLRELAPKIRDAVPPEQFAMLDFALNG
jgi:hypothetical protein